MANLTDALRGQLSQEVIDVLQRAYDHSEVDAQIETITAAGALTPGAGLSLLDVDGTQALTLADGSFVGQNKHIRCIAAANTPDATLTPDNLADGATIGFDAVDEYVHLRWTGSAWRIVSITGATLA